MATKGGEGLADRLLIPNIGVEALKEGESTPLFGRNVVEALVEEDKEGYRLNGNCLSPCIGSTDNHRFNGRVGLQ